jgi:hypothetical protein
VVSRFVRRVRTASGAVAVQIVVKEHGEVVEVDHVGSAHTDTELALLMTAAANRLHSGQEVLDLGPLSQPEVRLADVADWTDTCRDQHGRDQIGAVNVVDAGGAVEANGKRQVAGGGRVVRTSALTLWSVLERAWVARVRRRGRRGVPRGRARPGRRAGVEGRHGAGP